MKKGEKEANNKRNNENSLQIQHQQSTRPTWLWALIIFAALMLLKHSQK